MKNKLFCFAIMLSCFLPCFSVQAKKYKATPAKGVAMHGNPKYGWNFHSFDYVNPTAPKGGALRLSAMGSYDSFNPFIIKGQSPAGIGMLFDTLMVESADEPFSEYGLIAQTIEMPKDRSWVAFNLNPKAKFSDGSPVTAEDIVFSFDVLREKGLPMYRYYYGNVEKVTAESETRVLFVFKEGENKELPLILGQMPVFSKQDWQGKDFDKTSLNPPLGSGPYKIAEHKVGRYIVYERNPDYWAKNEPVVKGMYNFDKIRYDYYRDETVALEAFKAGVFDLRIESEAKKWVLGYQNLSEKNGLIKTEFKHGYPSGMQGFVFNTRRPIFQDRNVRKALGLVFDFEWSNKNLFYGLYQRTESYFDNSELAAKGYPKKMESGLLKPFKDELPKEVLQIPFKVSKTSGTGDIRPELKEAFKLLEQSGWTVQNGVLQNDAGEPFEFEILIDSASASAWERIALPYIRNLKRLGVKAVLRSVDSTQYKNRLDTFDFDMIVNVWGQSMSPGNEQRYFWGSESADRNGSNNYAGIKSKPIDALIEKVIEAPNRLSLLAATRALDRVLLWGYYVIPHWFVPTTRIAYWDKFSMKNQDVLKGVQIMSWWANPNKEQALKDLKQKEKEAKNAKEITVLEYLREWF